MKTLNIPFEDEEHQYLSRVKRDQKADSWRELFLTSLGYVGTAPVTIPVEGEDKLQEEDDEVQEDDKQSDDEWADL